MVDPNTLSSLVGMKVEDAESVLKRMFAEDKKIPPTWEPDLDIGKMSVYFDEIEKNKLTITATIKMGGDA